MKSSAKKLRDICRLNNWQLLQCRRPGRWIISMPGGRPSCEDFIMLIDDLHQIGYIYSQDGYDNEEYYIQVIKCNKIQ